MYEINGFEKYVNRNYLNISRDTYSYKYIFKIQKRRIFHEIDSMNV